MNLFSSTCEVCGCEVVDWDLHTEWHKKINEIAKTASTAERWSSTLRPIG